MSMHNSGRMLLALYANGMVRLWNLLDARCINKRMLGLSADSEESDAEEDKEKEDEKEDKAKEEKDEDDDDENEDSEEKLPKEKSMIDKYLNRPELIKWEPKKGVMYAVLFGKMLEIYTVEDDQPIHSITFDTCQTSFDFLSDSSLVVGDQEGRLTIFMNCDKPDTIKM